VRYAKRPIHARRLTVVNEVDTGPPDLDQDLVVAGLGRRDLFEHVDLGSTGLWHLHINMVLWRLWRWLTRMALIVLGMELEDMARKASGGCGAGQRNGRDDLVKELYSVDKIARCYVMQE
jgi:hypothetical protein